MRKETARKQCFNTQPPEGGWEKGLFAYKAIKDVSTHSRPKAAGKYESRARGQKLCFNTQPPEGGWLSMLYNHTI